MTNVENLSACIRKPGILDRVDDICCSTLAPQSSPKLLVSCGSLLPSVGVYDMNHPTVSTGSGPAFEAMSDRFEWHVLFHAGMAILGNHDLVYNVGLCLLTYSCKAAIQPVEYGSDFPHLTVTRHSSGNGVHLTCASLLL